MEEIIAKEGGNGSSIPPHPEGQFAARCIDIIDLGMVQTTWQGNTKEQHKIVLRFFCGEYFIDSENNERPLWVDIRLTLSLHEKAALRKFLEAWRARKFTHEELQGFNVAKLLGVDALIQVSHNVTPDRTYANIDSCMKLPKGMTPAPQLADYVRVKDRPPREEPVKRPAGMAAGRVTPFDDDDDDLSDLPF